MGREGTSGEETGEGGHRELEKEGRSSIPGPEARWTGAG